MALLGVQLVITMVMASIIQKLGPHYSLARWLLCSTGLTRYLYPTNEELKALAGIPKVKGKGKKSKEENGRSFDTFHVARNLDIQLETASVTSLDVVHLKFYPEYQWIVDFSLYSIIVYILTEVYYALLPVKDEVNLSMLWSLLVLGCSIKVLGALSAQYFRGGEESAGERATVVVSALAHLVLSMAVLVADENTLELGLDTAYATLNRSSAAALSLVGPQNLLSHRGPASKIVLKFCIALWCGLVGALFTFPGLRMARMHWDCTRYCGERRFLKVLLNLSFASPLLVAILWVKPVSRDYLSNFTFSGMNAPMMTEGTFDSLRLAAVISMVLLRFILMPIYLQAYLNMAHNRIEEQKKEAGRIKNVDLQKKIAAVFYYLCVVTLQYVAPLLMCLFFTLMYKTMGGYSWLGYPLVEEECSAEDSSFEELTSEDDESIELSARRFTLALSILKQVFSTGVYRGLLGFGLWWCCFAIFVTSSLGMVYQSYFGQT
ncbi:transmembrane protein 161B [Hetaerina americana]|uniref:transmembrane protein 161B n=1 Tax=Hetaerina americana TaxID=62018 RepID=UPI003A7F541E